MTRAIAKRKARGAFFTPPPLATFMAGWAIRSPQDRVLDPAAGEGALLLAAESRLRQLGAQIESEALLGIELHPTSAARAAQATVGSIIRGDAFKFDRIGLGKEITVLLGNPPWVRYHTFTGRRRIRALAAAAASGVVLNARSSFWAPYLVHAISFLHAEGRLAVVLPSEFLTVDYAGPVREFLSHRFRSITVVRFDRPVFQDLEVDALLLMADNEGPVGVRQVRADSIDKLPPPSSFLESRFHPVKQGMRWSDDEVCAKAEQLLMLLRERDDVISLGEVAHVSLGIVTGAKGFFLLSDEEVADNRLSRQSLVPVLPSARDMRGLLVTRQDWIQLRKSGRPGWLLRCAIPRQRLNGQAVGIYIRKGERNGANLAFKCSVRSPWYRLQIPRPPDAFLTYLGAERIRLMTNSAEIVATNLLHQVRWIRPFRRGHSYRTLPAVFLSSLTQIGVELLGRTYGGGVIKVEPSDARRLPIVVPNGESRLRLEPGLAGFDHLVRSRKDQQATELVDEILLSGQLALTAEQRRVLSEAHQILVSRRRH